MLKLTATNVARIFFSLIALNFLLMFTLALAVCFGGYSLGRCLATRSPDL